MVAVPQERCCICKVADKIRESDPPYPLPEEFQHGEEEEVSPKR